MKNGFHGVSFSKPKLGVFHAPATRIAGIAGQVTDLIASHCRCQACAGALEWPSSMIRSCNICMLAVLGLAAAGAWEPSSTTPTAAASIRSIRAMEDDQLRQQPEVLLRGVVTFHDARGGLTYLQDADGGIEVRELPADAGLKPGQRVEISGGVDGSRSIPGIIAAPGSLVLLESEPLPPAVPLVPTDPHRRNRRTPGDDGSFDFRHGARPRTQGSLVVADQCRHAFRPSHVVGAVGGDQPLPLELLHAKVRGTGICEAIFNNRGQRIGMLLVRRFHP